MGYIRHHAIVVTSQIDELFNAAYEKAKSIFGDLVSNPVEGVVNGYKTFVIAPDGSKESWSPSKEHDEKRERFTEWIYSKDHDDGSNSISFAEIYFGDEEGNAAIIRHN